MESGKIKNYAEFRKWVKIRLVEEEISQRELARKMGIPHARISEATHGKQQGNKYIIPVIENLDGDLKDFQEFFKTINKEVQLSLWMMNNPKSGSGTCSG